MEQTPGRAAVPLPTARSLLKSFSPMSKLVILWSTKHGVGLFDGLVKIELGGIDA